MWTDFLSGKWLKHPLHPILAHFPVGLWPAAFLFDLLSQSDWGGNAVVRLSFYAIAAGLLASLLAIPTGLTDWSGIKKEKPAWKLGVYHMTANLVVVVLYAVNFGLRFATYREAATVSIGPLLLSLIGIILLALSTFLGGRMVYAHGISVARFSKRKLRRMAEAGGARLAPEQTGRA